MQEEVKNQMNQIRDIVSEQESSMQNEIHKLIKLTEDSERDRKLAIQEIKSLRDEFQRQKE